MVAEGRHAAASTHSGGTVMTEHTFQTQPLRRVETAQPAISLTFDDGPHPELTPRILDALAHAGARATFFCKACFVRQYPELARQALREGHEIANHTVNHPDLDRLASVEEIRNEIVHAQEIIQSVTGCVPKLFRAPCGRHDERVWQVLREFGLPSVLMSVNPRDWDRDNATAESIEELATVGLRAGDIVLFHDWQPHTAAALPGILQKIHAANLKAVTVSELLFLAGK